jgi:hypothetical protein
MMNRTRRRLTTGGVLAFCTLGCGARSPIVPSSARTASTLSLEAEAGVGQGDRKERPSASGGVTIHLAPGERREWTFTLLDPSSEYAVFVRYSNDEIGDSETIRATVDGLAIGSFHAQDTGDNGAGWNAFVSDRVGAAGLSPGSHTLVVASSGGDGCIEVDLVTLVPAQSAGG